jgi:SAM-dependent methyltransferase
MLSSILYPFLRFKYIRYRVVKFRYLFFNKRIRIKQDVSASTGEQTITHNLDAFKNLAAAFGCGERMGLLIYPLVGYYSFYKIDKSKLRVLIVGCRTEDDIYWMRAYGFTQTIGLDLFSYSRNILVGDIHKTDFEDASFDIVLLGWMISYTKNPAEVIRECRRILKKDGLLGIGIDHDPKQNNNDIKPPRVNTLNSTADIISLLDSVIHHKVVFEYNHYNQHNDDLSTSVISICK